MTQTMKRFIIITCLIFLAGALACQTPGGRSMGQVTDDATITTKVKAKLVEDKQLSAITISVQTFQGEVTLTGSVEVADNIQRATNLAKSVTGVKKVNNLLKVQ